jgi:hypothetical protein
MTLEEIEAELQYLATKEQVEELRAEIRADFGNFKAQVQSEFGNFKAEIYKNLGDFKADLLKTLWLAQFSMAGIILVGVGILLHWK